MSYEIITHSLMVKPVGRPIFDEAVTTIKIEDEAGGPFLIVSQHGADEMGQITIEECTWPAIRDAIEAQLEVCRKIEAEEAK